MKLTNEAFPRLLSTRKVEDDGAEYFGPFLSRSGARVLIDFMNLTFRLRTCSVRIDGGFPVPCTQYYAKRCAGPCVESLCGREEYLALVGLARLFLKNDRKEFELSVMAWMDAAAEQLDFERAAYFRDLLAKARAFWAHPRRRVWLDDAVDTFVIDREADVATVFIITTRRSRTLGSWTSEFQIFEDTDLRELLSDVILQFYTVGGPREVRVPFDFPNRAEAARELRKRFGRPVKIVVEGQVPERVTALKALARTKLNLDLENLKPAVTPERIQRQLTNRFRLASPPERIEAFDAAHISGTFSTAGMAVWQAGRLVGEEYREGLSERTGEIDTLKEFLNERLSLAGTKLPGLILVDGGKAHVNATVKVLQSLSLTHIPVVGAVKPPKRHKEISHFLSPDGSQIEFDPLNPAMQVLKLLRDEAHELANAAHRKSRDMAHFYELPAILPSLNERERQLLWVRLGSLRQILGADDNQLIDILGPERGASVLEDIENYNRGNGIEMRPLIVPIRYDDPNGEAGDLRPINTLNRDLIDPAAQ